MKNNFKVGDYVYFKNSDEGVLFESGMVINICNNTASILTHDIYKRNWIETVNLNNVRPITDELAIVGEINDFYTQRIKEEELKLKSVKRADYQEEIKSKYLLLKEEILNTCKNILKTTDDYEFEMKLKAICRKKTSLFTIEYEGLNEARKFNGEIKHNIKELIRNRMYCLEGLNYSMEAIKSKINKMEEL